MANEARKLFVVGMAGHVDHGKSSVIKALTGITTARYREEVERQITIDIGFAYLDVEGVGRVSIIDVPGHEDYVHNMLAGAFGMKVALLVVAANEGVMPQTAEHFEILGFCGVERLIVVLNKCDLVSDYDAGIRKLEIEDFLKGTRYEGARIVAFSAASGEGAGELVAAMRDEIEDLCGRYAAAPGESAVIFPLDRVFEKTGYGNIFTGTLVSGAVACGDALRLVPGGWECRVRSIESHGERKEAVGAVARAALGVVRPRESSPRRGSFLVTPGFGSEAKVACVIFRTARGLRHPVKSGARVKVFFHTACYLAKIRLLSGSGAGAGETVFAQLIFDAPAFALAGRKFVVRAHTDEETLGGGIFLEFSDSLVRNKKKVLADLAPYEGAFGMSEAALGRLSVKAILGRRHFISAGEAAERLSVSPKAAEAALAVAAGVPAVRVSDLLLTTSPALDALKAKIAAAAAGHFSSDPLADRIPVARLASLVENGAAPPGKGAAEPPAGGDLLAAVKYAVAEMAAGGALEFRDGSVFRKMIAPAERTLADPQAESVRKKIAALFASGASTASAAEPKTLDQVKSALPRNLHDTFARTVRFMEDEKQIFRIFENYYMSPAQTEICMKAISGIVERKGSFTVIDFKEATGLSRKFAIGILEYFDRISLTVRNGNDRTLR